MDQIEQLYKESDYKFEQKLLQSCEIGNLSFIEEFVNSKIKKDDSFRSTIWHMLEKACKGKQAKIVEYIFQSDCLIKLINKERAIERCFQDASVHGGLEITKYLLDLEVEHDMLYGISSGCRIAIDHHHQDIVKYILNHPKATTFLRYELKSPILLKEASQSNNLEALNYLISFPKLMENGKSYLYSNADDTLSFAIMHNIIDIVRFLVWEIGLEKNKEIDQYLQENPNEEITKIFSLKDMNKSLNKELPIRSNNVKKIKL